MKKVETLNNEKQPHRDRKQHGEDPEGNRVGGQRRVSGG